MFPFDRHNTLRKDLAAYADGELTARAAAAVERHLAACEPCRTQLDALRLAATALKALPAADAPRSFAVTPDMLGTPSRQLPARALPAYQTGMRLAAGGLAVALAVVVFADRSDFGIDGGFSNEAQLQELDNRLSQTFGANADSAAEPPVTGYESRDPEPTGQENASGIGAAGATQAPGDPLAVAPDRGADVTPGSLPEHDAFSDEGDTDGDTKSSENASGAGSDAETSQDDNGRETAAAADDDSTALTVVEVVLAVLLAAALGGLAFTWIAQRRKPL